MANLRKNRQSRVGGNLNEITRGHEQEATHGGVPQGTKLGFTLSTIMINRLLGDWHSRLKYVDGTTDFEVIPRNSSIARWILLLEIFNNYSSSPNGLLTKRP